MVVEMFPIVNDQSKPIITILILSTYKAFLNFKALTKNDWLTEGISNEVLD